MLRRRELNGTVACGRGYGHGRAAGYEVRYT